MKQKSNSLIKLASCALFAAPLALLLSSQASAQTTVFSDDFSDNNRDGWYIFNGGDPIERSLDASGGNLETVSSGNFAIWGALSNFSSVTIADGQYITLSLDYTVIEAIGGENMTFGLYSSGGTTISSDQTDLTNLGNESGYANYVQSDEMRLIGSTAGLGNVNGNDTMNKVTYAGNDNPFALVGSYTYSLTVENIGGQITATTVYNAGQANELTQTDSGSAIDIFTFDTIAIQAIRQDYSVDNIVITTTGTVIPEPSSFALLAGMLGLTSVMLRRRG